MAATVRAAMTPPTTYRPNEAARLRVPPQSDGEPEGKHDQERTAGDGQGEQRAGHADDEHHASRVPRGQHAAEACDQTERGRSMAPQRLRCGRPQRRRKAGADRDRKGRCARCPVTDQEVQQAARERDERAGDDLAHGLERRRAWAIGIDEVQDQRDAVRRRGEHRRQDRIGRPGMPIDGLHVTTRQTGRRHALMPFQIHVAMRRHC